MANNNTKGNTMTCCRESQLRRARQKWYFSDYKLIKVFGHDTRVAFQRKGTAYTRGVTLSKAAFLNIDDVTLVPGMTITLERNCVLRSLGKRIQLIRYCYTRDQQRCQGGFFYFTPSEWQFFLHKLRPAIVDHLAR